MTRACTRRINSVRHIEACVKRLILIVIILVVVTISIYYSSTIFDIALAKPSTTDNVNTVDFPRPAPYKIKFVSDYSSLTDVAVILKGIKFLKDSNGSFLYYAGAKIIVYIDWKTINPDIEVIIFKVNISIIYEAGYSYSYEELYEASYEDKVSVLEIEFDCNSPSYCPSPRGMEEVVVSVSIIDTGE